MDQGRGQNREQGDKERDCLHGSQGDLPAGSLLFGEELKGLEDERVRLLFQVRARIPQRYVHGYALALVASHVCGVVHLEGKGVFPSIGQFFLQHVRKDSIGGFPHDRDLREFGHHHGKDVRSAEGCIMSEQDDRFQVGVFMRIKVSGLELCKAIRAGFRLGLAVMPNPLPVCKAAGDLVNALVGPTGVESNVDDQSFRSVHRREDFVEGVIQFVGANALELRNQEISQVLAPAIDQQVGCIPRFRKSFFPEGLDDHLLKLLLQFAGIELLEEALCE